MRKSWYLVLMLSAALILASACPALSATTIEPVNVPAVYAPGTAFSGYLKLVFDAPIPTDSQLRASIRGSSATQTLSMQPYLSGVSYQYKQYSFTYNITAQGASAWYEYPERPFYARLGAEGTCGNEECALAGNCDCAGLTGMCTPSAPTYSCYWSITRLPSEDLYESVSASQGLAEITDASLYITPPPSANADTRWLQMLDTATQYGVQTTMRAYCGGWMRATLVNGAGVPPTGRKFYIEPFDESTLVSPGREQFAEGDCAKPYICGGIYKNTVRLTSTSQFKLNGSLGEITIISYDPNSVYTVTYLPPNGPVLCAYTSYKLSNSSQWTAKSVPQSGSVSYNTPFSKTYSASELPLVFNDTNRVTALVKPQDCPAYVPASECQQTVSSYSAVKYVDPAGTVQVSYNSQTRTASATTSSQEITQKYIRVNLSGFTDLKAPSATGGYTLDVSLLSSGSEIASQEIPFTVCEDGDGDGYCKADDCNDTNKNLNPGMKELCNSIDDDCDGEIDEDFHQAGMVLGTPCGVGGCAGKWVCKPDGTDVTCNGPAPRAEICSNKIDDNCDGVVDEDPGCTSVECGKDDAKPCGSNVGECSEGHRICISGNWSVACFDSAGPFEEVCNNKDDDCDGVEDDLYNGSSAEETACGCYGTGEPVQETCDGIDNDCNGQIDDGIKCCTSSQARECGIRKGICTKGTQICVNGQWEQKCRGGITPNPAGEVCYNGLDDNCNGQVDERCTPSFTCRNGKQDTNEEGIDCGGPCPENCGLPYNWMLFAGGVMLLIIAIILLEMRSAI